MPEAPDVVGDRQFLSRRSIAVVVRTPAPPARLIQRLIAQIAERRALSVAEICSKSRRRELVIARPQIVWLATHWNFATLTDVARHLNHSPSAMTRAVARYRYSRPELFTKEIFAPGRLGNIRAVSIGALSWLKKKSASILPQIEKSGSSVPRVKAIRQHAAIAGCAAGPGATAPGPDMYMISVAIGAKDS